MPEKTNKEKKKRASPKNKGRGKKQKLLHFPIPIAVQNNLLQKRNDQHEPREDPSSHEHTEPGDIFPYDQHDFRRHQSPTETSYQSETNEEDTPLMENDQKRTWGKHSPPRSQ